ncbi:MAG: hypothetical protein H7A35_03390 [Planctomycetales bacterium]|nr:hypothetical protein [bacterium]UNM09098.1 MAG: hypothetical protein H7A35_03390 [Planctomycetales bacterium]
MTLDFQSAAPQNVMVQVLVDGEWRDTATAGVSTLKSDVQDDAADGVGPISIEVDSYLTPGKDDKPVVVKFRQGVEYIVRLRLLVCGTDEGGHLMAGGMTL